MKFVHNKLSDKSLIASMYIFRFVSNFTNIVMIRLRIALTV